ncbi:MFS transporter [Tichowtungia aerotolerans]|uniref:MFS transporter n=1 Tax=Tichowtungia aerotolerans TaxID=2697043 RepID=A0A6P1M1D1_9BACT|nr:MFS transporter [Tichowtungia aerotolerans]QHI68390.1 MFS transporter [Tichowtungia aerotolerans]
MSSGVDVKPVSGGKIFGYALGDGAVSITMNGIATFAMLYYTQVLGLNPVHAGLALSITLFWDAITDPLMGCISDNTRSRFGRRIPYMVGGGVVLALSFFLLWVLPGRLSSMAGVFFCVLLMNVLLRTASTVFIIPYLALGFEMCPEYVDRSRLQGARFFVNQTTNLLFTMLAWTLFFKDGVGEGGERIDGTLIAQNYLIMGGCLTVAILIAVGACVFNTRRYAVDNRQEQLEGKSLKVFAQEIGAILKDRLAWYVFGFLGVALLGIFLTSQVQMFTYVFYMKFTGMQKAFVHCGGMLAFALFALNLPVLVKRFDKKRAGFIGMGISAVGSLALLITFTGGILSPQAVCTVAGFQIPIAVIVFGILQALWWGGCGVMIPLATSMIADVSEIHQEKTGNANDGGYASVLSFFMKASNGIGMMLTGQLIALAGIVSKADSQTVEAARNISVITFLCGPVLLAVSFVLLRKYPVDRGFMEKMRKNKEEI